MSEEQQALLTKFDTTYETVLTNAKQNLLRLAASFNLAVDGGEDPTKLRALLDGSPTFRMFLEFLDADDPEIAEALRELGLALST